MLSIHTSIFIGICAVAVVCLNCAAVVAEFAAVQAGGEVVPGDATPSKRRTARDDVPPHAPQVLSWSPRVVLYPEFLSDEECEVRSRRAVAAARAASLRQEGALPHTAAATVTARPIGPAVLQAPCIGVTIVQSQGIWLQG